MQIVKTSRYLDELEVVLDFIAKDSLIRALEFSDRLNEKIFDLDNMPYRNRKSVKSDDSNVRDLIFHGYVVPYRINIDKGRIEIVGIYGANEWGL